MCLSFLYRISPFLISVSYIVSGQQWSIVFRYRVNLLTISLNVFLRMPEFWWQLLAGFPLPDIKNNMLIWPNICHNVSSTVLVMINTMKPYIFRTYKHNEKGSSSNT